MSVNGGGGEGGVRESEEDALWAPLCQVDPCIRNYADVSLRILTYPDVC